MPTVHIIAVGRIKPGPLKDLISDYQKRIGWNLRLHEIDIRDAGPQQQVRENQAVFAALPDGATVFCLDERGKTMKSADFSRMIQTEFDDGRDVAFVIGGADGLLDTVRGRAKHLIAFGMMTWPHQLVRVMLVEQLYRAQQIVAGHPYHRE